MSTHTTSAARVLANQQNAKQSTGPRTPEGKAASSQNSTKHGLAASDDTLARQYPAEIQALITEYAKRYLPREQVMHDLLLQMASARLRQDRAAQLENLALANEPNLDQLALLTKLERYRKSAEASYHRALKQLQAIDAQYCALEVAEIRAARHKKAVAAALESGRQYEQEQAASRAEMIKAMRSRDTEDEDFLKSLEESETPAAARR